MLLHFISFLFISFLFISSHFISLCRSDIFIQFPSVRLFGLLDINPWIIFWVIMDVLSITILLCYSYRRNKTKFFKIVNFCLKLLITALAVSKSYNRRQFLGGSQIIFAQFVLTSGLSISLWLWVTTLRRQTIGVNAVSWHIFCTNGFAILFARSIISFHLSSSRETTSLFLFAL